MPPRGARNAALIIPPLSYRISAEPRAHLFRVTLSISEADPEGQILALPAWVPGSYTIRDLARHVTQIRAERNGQDIALHKIAKDRWRLAPGHGPVVVHYAVYAFDRSVRTTYLDDQGGFFNGPAIYLRVSGQEAQTHAVLLEGPEDWQVGTALPRQSGAVWSWGGFEASGFDALIDHPVLMGPLTLLDFEVGERPHHLLIQGTHQADLQRLGADLTRICDWQQRFWGDAAFTGYHFLCMTSTDGYGGLEHRASSALLCARDDLSGRNEDHYRRFLGLASHEYFHGWLVQAIRPAVLGASALDREVLTRDLWVFEGITSYYDDLCLRRAGLTTPAQYLCGVGKELTRLLRRPGRFLQSVAESSEDAWIRLYHPHVNSANFEISYYNKGALLALCLDLSLRLESAGALSLDTVLGRLWQDYGRTGIPLPEGQCVGIVEDLAGPALAGRLQDWITARTDLPLPALLAEMGIALRLRAASGPQDEGGEPAEKTLRAWLGAQWLPHALGVQLRHVQTDSPAEQAGLSPDDILVALDGVRTTAEQLPEQLDAVPEGAALRIQFFRDNILRETRVTPTAPPRDTAWLELLEDVDDVVLARRRAWLEGTGAVSETSRCASLPDGG
ncbi:PDZ domain protein [Acidithiobacillus ferrooxidans ATCC 23270]|uniref:PDZ domain protein n=1 Tax=Acidithiobacillus ferrooxidans (strain ATCC 23270 / DSM 14882 / CIP 104768 / NCIMB 8455) TaxID=243159 RepID=B7J4Z5_ACIF2|nr:PDZ domain protein [Acidithiobacillus ferrooxidans ATCC 23270]